MAEEYEGYGGFPISEEEMTEALAKEPELKLKIRKIIFESKTPEEEVHKIQEMIKGAPTVGEAHVIWKLYNKESEGIRLEKLEEQVVGASTKEKLVAELKARKKIAEIFDRAPTMEAAYKYVEDEIKKASTQEEAEYLSKYFHEMLGAGGAAGVGPGGAPKPFKKKELTEEEKKALEGVARIFGPPIKLPPCPVCGGKLYDMKGEFFRKQVFCGQCAEIFPMSQFVGKVPGAPVVPGVPTTGALAEAAAPVESPIPGIIIAFVGLSIFFSTASFFNLWSSIGSMMWWGLMSFAGFGVVTLASFKGGRKRVKEEGGKKGGAKGASLFGIPSMKDIITDLVGIIPVIGDIIGFVLELMWINNIISKAAETKDVAAIREKVIMAIIIDCIAGLVPVLGDILDFFIRPIGMIEKMVEGAPGKGGEKSG